MPSINPGGTDLYGYDPDTGALRQLAPLPGGHVNPIFCGDRSGHLYASARNVGTDVWQYDVETDAWTLLPVPLPFDHDANGACTVTDSGYLYVTDTGSLMARLALL